MTPPVVELWTDGSGNTTKLPGGWAYVLRFIHPETGEITDREDSGGVEPPLATNNRMELTAVIRGLQALKVPCRVTIVTDSEYIANPFRKHYIHSWRKKRWRKADGAAVKNADLWQELVAEIDKHEVTFEWVPGHAGHTLNERCDELAGIARRQLLQTSGSKEKIAS